MPHTFLPKSFNFLVACTFPLLGIWGLHGLRIGTRLVKESCSGGVSKWVGVELIGGFNKCRGVLPEGVAKCLCLS